MGVENEVVYHQQFAFFFTKPVKLGKLVHKVRKRLVLRQVLVSSFVG